MQNNIDQEHDNLKTNDFCWLCKNPVNRPPEEFPSNQIQKGDLMTSLNFKNLLKQEFLHFCENTTIRGIPRIVKTTSKTSRILWICFFIFLCGGLTVYLTFLIRQFVEYNVIHPPRVLQNKYSPFPSFTLCNHRPLSYSVSSFLSKRKMNDPREFAVKANFFAQRYLYEKNDTASYALLTSSLSLSGYLESIPLKYHKLLGHDMKDFIIECLVTFKNGSKHGVNKCHFIGNWTNTPHAQFINCFSYNVDDEFIDHVYTIEIYLYLNEQTNNSRCLDCFISNVKSQLSGALLVIHKSKSFPNIDQEAINLQPGTLTEVRLKTFFNVMKVPPYGRCETSTPESLQMGDKTYSYTVQLCKEKTIQSEINKKCKCNAIEYPIIEKNLSFCGALPKFVYHDKCKTQSSATDRKQCYDDMQLSIKNLKCKSSITVLYHNDIIETCFLQCSYYSYESDRSISTWPAKSWQLTWLNSSKGAYIRNKMEMKDYIRALSLFNQGKEDKAVKILKTLDILEKKLISVIINKPNNKLHKVEEKEVLSLTSLLSQIGGLFSMWIGLTLISIVEIIDLIMKIYERVRFKLYKNRQMKLNEMRKNEIFDHSFKNCHFQASAVNL